MKPQVFLTHFQKVLRAIKLLNHCYEKDLDDEEAKVLFFYPSLRNECDYIHFGNCDFDSETVEDLKIFSKATAMPVHPSNPIVTMTKAKPLVATTPLSFLVIVSLIQWLLPILLPIATTNDPTIAIAPTCHVMPVNHVFTTNTVSVKDTHTIEWAECKMHNPAYDTKTAKD